MNKKLKRDDATAAAAARNHLVSAGSIHWFHWAIFCLSLMLTFFAWHYSSSQLQARISTQFDREADQVIELVQERMNKYEYALWSGVAFVRANNEDVDFELWKTYAESIDVEEKYPGINGIGIIHAVSEDQLPAYLKSQRQSRPDYSIHPSHDNKERLPISYVIPVQGNEKAVGLDMVHEQNRYSAAMKARDSATAQITGPITLVQDAEKTPGFLFYAPYYRGAKNESISDRRDHFLGMVYAPFVVKKLMEGTLAKTKRNVGIRLIDQSSVLYDEHVSSEIDYDPDPLFKRSTDVVLYGRTWKFDIWSAKSFRDTANDSQPVTILVSGLLIDALLVVLFISISRTSKKALRYADSMTLQLKVSESKIQKNQAFLAKRAKQLETSNAELEQFAYIASHDLQEPLRKVAAFCSLLAEDYEEQLDDDGKRYIAYAVDGAARMKTLIQDLLMFSRVEAKEKRATEVDLAKSFAAAVGRLESAIRESNAVVTADELPTVYANASQITQLLQNLIGNGIKYRGELPPTVHLGVDWRGDELVFSVCDNGIGIDPQYHDQIFGIFKRLHSRERYSGTGIGLAICKRIVERFGGRIWIESEEEQGCKVCFTLPETKPKTA